MTENGLIRWVLVEAREDDVVYVFESAKLPYVLRRSGKEDVHAIIGHGFLHGIMFGETSFSHPFLLMLS